MRTAVSAAAVVGLNVTDHVATAFTASAVVAGVTVKSPAFAPVTAQLPKFRVSVPVFVIVNVCAADIVFSS